MSVPGRRAHSRHARRLGLAWGVCGALGAGGCFVSFDAYKLAEKTGGSAGTSDTSSAEGGATLGQGGIAGLPSRGGMTAVNEAGAGGSGDSDSGGATTMGGEAGASTGGAGVSSGGASAGGASTGGANTKGGAGAGGVATSGGAATAGAGGKGNGGANTGGANTGGANTGGANTGGGGAAAGTGGAGGNTGTGGSAPATCPILSRGPILVEIPRPTGFFCIDRTEVTNSDYGLFLASNPSTANQGAACAWNTSFSPETGPDCASTNYDPTNRAKTPVDCIDWCDAAKYCEWAGKHLCGAIGGGANLPAAFADPAKSEWYSACSHGGDFDFPYGDSFQIDACIGVDSPQTRAAPVPTASCQGGYEGVYDMSGNLAEWEDSCSASAGAGDLCSNRGGSYLSSDTGFPSLRCNSNLSGNPRSKTSRRDLRSQEVGFRCCYDP